MTRLIAITAILIAIPLATHAQIAYIGKVGRQQKLLIETQDGVEEIAGGNAATWSPDGKKVAYTLIRDQGLYIIGEDKQTRKMPVFDLGFRVSG